MTEAEIRARFKDSDFVLKLKKKTVENEDDTVLKKFLHKYLRCPKCKIPIEKIDGYVNQLLKFKLKSKSL